MNSVDKQTRQKSLIKTCTRCGIVKPKTEFFRNAGMFDGRARRCKRCESAHKARRQNLMKAMLTIFEERCFKCGSVERLTVDHHLPISKGGALGLSNCVLLCVSCNSRKHHRAPGDFYTPSELQRIEAIHSRALGEHV